MTTDPGERRYVDNAAIAPEPPTNAERRDIQVEREAIEYNAMFDEVEAELAEYAAECGLPGLKPDGRHVHEEAMRRLRAKYAQ